MKAVIDTSSLLSLVRYYLPFDGNGILFGFFKEKIEIGEIVLLDAVLQECRFVSGKIIVERLDFLMDKEFLKAWDLPLKTDELLPVSPQRFLNQLKNQFANQVQIKRLNDAEFEVQKKNFLESADAKLVLYCQHLIQKFPEEEVFLITEETGSANDLKLFKKMPAICKILDIPTLTLPDLIKRYEGIDLDFRG